MTQAEGKGTFSAKEGKKSWQFLHLQTNSTQNTHGGTEETEQDNIQPVRDYKHITQNNTRIKKEESDEKGGAPRNLTFLFSRSRNRSSRLFLFSSLVSWTSLD